MILEFILIVLSLISAFSALLAIVIDLEHARGVNWQAVGGFVFFMLLFDVLINQFVKKHQHKLKLAGNIKTIRRCMII